MPAAACEARLSRMKTREATKRLTALSQETRLKVFRLLAREGATGLPAGRIAEELGVRPATLSFHLSLLEKAGLLKSRRESRSIIYSVDVPGTRALLAFLTEDCCQGHPELCLPVDEGAERPVKAH